MFYRSCLTALTEQITEARVTVDGVSTYPTPAEGRVPARITLKDKISACLDYRYTYCDFGKARDFFDNSEDDQLLEISRVLRHKTSSWRNEAFAFINNLANDWDLQPCQEDDVVEKDPNQNDLANLNIDPR